jgi:hypothetical protein
MDEDAVKNFIFYMENTLQSLEVPNLGHVEIVVEDSSKPSDEKKIAVVVAKPSISSDVSKRDGFYQTCASMIIYGVRYGIYTSHENWAFLRLDEASAFDGGTPTSKGRGISRSKVFSLMKPAYDELDEQAVDMYAHLLEIVGVSPDVDLLECAASSAVNQNALAPCDFQEVSVTRVRCHVLATFPLITPFVALLHPIIDHDEKSTL